ncbi:hypothetical protein FHT76_005182 [Rhizobium sp. BK176]|nr:hypothetical protein [Rhizobium sp. BK399]MCS3741785.1 hypothetical protein [Rhizobium sp. BK661]MCS4093488.1 hypothetical protein [Rhizobium sp. BK176]
MGEHRLPYHVRTGDHGSCSVIDTATGFPAEIDENIDQADAIVSVASGICGADMRVELSNACNDLARYDFQLKSTSDLGSSHPSTPSPAGSQPNTTASKTLGNSTGIPLPIT